MKKLKPFNYEDATLFLNKLSAAIETKDEKQIKEVIASNTITWRVAPKPRTEHYNQLLQQYSILINQSTEILFPEHT